MRSGVIGGFAAAVLAACGFTAAVLSACGGAPAGPANGRGPGDGGLMLVVSDRGGAWRVYELVAGGAAGEVATGGAARIVGSPGAAETAYQDGMPARLPDGRIVFVSDRDGAPAILLAEPGSHTATRLIGDPSGSGGRFGSTAASGSLFADTAPAPLGPDRIVFARRNRSDPPGSPRDLYSVRLDGTHLKQLTRHPADDDAPSGARDGRSVVFVSDRAGTPHLFLLADVDSADPEALAIDLSSAAAAGEMPAGAGYADRAPCLLADGSIVFSRSLRGGPPQLFVMGRTGRRMALRQITDPLTLRYGADEPVLQVDGSILFVTGPALAAAPHAVYQIALGGFNLTRVTRDRAHYSDFTRRF